jgi:hypothetical protein
MQDSQPLKDEAALYDHAFQPYGPIGTQKRQFSDSYWEDAMPCFVPKTKRMASGQTEPEKNFGGH